MTRIALAARGRITTHFREDIGRGFLHNGIDQGHGGGEPADLEIRAPADGVVTAHGTLGSYGKRLVIRHADGWTSLLAHHAWQGVKTGDIVHQYDPIAVMGNTGTVFVHSHQELCDQNGTQLDPLLHLGTAAAGNGSTKLENDMPLDNGDLVKILTAGFDNRILGSGNNRTIQNALSAVYFYGDLAQANAVRIEALAQNIERISNVNWTLLNRPSETIDTAKLAEQLKAAGITVTVDGPALAKLLEASLSDDFAAIPGAVRDAIIK